jgi:hypothetical protein
MKVKILIVMITLIMGIYGSSRSVNTNVRTQARMFCAYDKIFIEFDDGKNVWGALWLDRDGMPVTCRDGKNISDNAVIL